MVLLGPFLITYAYEGVRFVLSVFTFDATMWFLLGAVVSVVVYPLLLGNSIGFVEHLLHELEHAAIAFFFTFRLPSRMEIDPNEGSEVRAPGGGGCLTTLAPYYLPLLTLPFLLLKALVVLAVSFLEIDFPNMLKVSLDLFIGATLAFHTTNAIIELTRGQDDIKKVGWLPSLGGLLFMNLLVLVLCIAVVTGSYAELWAYVRTAAAATVDAYRAAYEYVQTQLLPLVGDLTDIVRDELCDGCTPTPVP